MSLVTFKSLTLARCDTLGAPVVTLEESASMCLSQIGKKHLPEWGTSFKMSAQFNIQHREMQCVIAFFFVSFTYSHARVMIYILQTCSENRLFCPVIYSIPTAEEYE